MSARTYKGKITEKGFEIVVLSNGTDDDFINLTGITKYKNRDEPLIVINNWRCLRNTIEYLGICGQLYNPDFNPIGFNRVLHETGAQMLPPQKWITSTGQ
jgi:hypothetical protein